MPKPNRKALPVPVKKQKTPAQSSSQLAASKSILALSDLFSRLREAPTSWIDSKDTARDKNTNQLEPLECESYEVLIDAWKQAMVWTEGLDAALAVMLASCTSTMLVGDQLWVKIIGPASCGKSTLCEALSVNTEYVLAKSTVRGFHSGFGEGEHNLIDQAKDKTLITKDGDTIIQSPNLSQILSEGRDLYDTVTRSSYRNKASKDHIGVRMTWILAGTSSLRQIDHSELGERFLDCVIMEGIDSDLELMICLSAAKEAAKSSQLEVTKSVETRHSPEMALAMRLTAGYVSFLRKNAADLTSKVIFTEADLEKTASFGVFVSHMRAKPSKSQDETSERELAARLTKQHTRLAMCLAAVLNKTRIDDQVFALTKKVALDTARGHSFTIAQKLFQSKTGMEFSALNHVIGMEETKLRGLLRFLTKLGVIESYNSDSNFGGVRGSKRYKLTSRFFNLYLKTMK